MQAALSSLTDNVITQLFTSPDPELKGVRYGRVAFFLITAAATAGIYTLTASSPNTFKIAGCALAGAAGSALTLFAYRKMEDYCWPTSSQETKRLNP